MLLRDLPGWTGVIHTIAELFTESVDMSATADRPERATRMARGRAPIQSESRS
jgi:hypothetical protein